MRLSLSLTEGVQLSTMSFYNMHCPVLSGYSCQYAVVSSARTVLFPIRTTQQTIQILQTRGFLGTCTFAELPVVPVGVLLYLPTAAACGIAGYGIRATLSLRHGLPMWKLRVSNALWPVGALEALWALAIAGQGQPPQRC